MNKLLLLLPTVALAEPFYITVPGEGWTLKLETPAMTNVKGASEGRRLQYMASSTESGITISLYAETEGTKSNDECRETFCSQGLRNPNIVKDSIKLTADDRASFATHLSEGTYQGRDFKTANGHAYFVRNGLCMDLHVSHYPYAEGSEQRVENVLRSIAIVQ
jgi:hypothetical protein